MAHRSVEVVIGRILTDEDVLERFTRDPERVLRSFAEQGLELTEVEIAGIAASAGCSWHSLAQTIDGRIRRASFNEPTRPTIRTGRRPARRGRTS
jgi:hypothetical protein